MSITGIRTTLLVCKFQKCVFLFPLMNSIVIRCKKVLSKTVPNWDLLFKSYLTCGKLDFWNSITPFSENKKKVSLKMNTLEARIDATTIDRFL